MGWWLWPYLGYNIFALGFPRGFGTPYDDNITGIIECCLLDLGRVWGNFKFIWWGSTRTMTYWAKNNALFQAYATGAKLVYGLIFDKNEDGGKLGRMIRTCIGGAFQVGMIVYLTPWIFSAMESGGRD